MTKEDLQQIAELMNSALSPINERLDSMQNEIRHTRVLVEGQQHEIQLIAEKVEMIDEKLEGMKALETKADNHDARIFALEVVTRALKQAE